MARGRVATLPNKGKQHRGLSVLSAIGKIASTGRVRKLGGELHRKVEQQQHMLGPTLGAGVSNWL
eukprot:12891354-Prorocentrum_lima.AAC.1